MRHPSTRIKFEIRRIYIKSKCTDRKLFPQDLNIQDSEKANLEMNIILIPLRYRSLMRGLVLVNISHITFCLISLK